MRAKMAENRIPQGLFAERIRKSAPAGALPYLAPGCGICRERGGKSPKRAAFYGESAAVKRACCSLRGGSAGPRLACGLRGKNRLFRGKRGGRREKTAGKSGRKGERKGNLAHVPGKTAGEGRRQRKNAAEREKRGRPGTAGKESRAEIVAFGGKSAFSGEGKVWEAREEAEKGRGRGRREKRGEPCGMTEKKEISGGSGEKRKSAAEGAEGRLGKAAEV